MKVSLRNLYPRKYNPFLTSKELPSVALQGNLKADGLTKYDLDFIETLKFTEKSLNFLQNLDLQKFPVEKIASKQDYLCFSVKEEYKYDYTKPDRHSDAALIVDLKRIPLKDSELQVLKSICSSKVSENDVLTLTLNDLNNAPHTTNVQEQLKFLSRIFLELVDKSKEISQNSKTQNVTRKPREFPFPTEWLQKKSVAN
jgi:hypothetical protein